MNMKVRFFDFALVFAAHLLAIVASPMADAAPESFGDDVWRLQLDPATGALVHIENATDAKHMNWLRDAGHWAGRNWTAPEFAETTTLDGQWGLVQTTHTGLLYLAKSVRISERAWEASYVGATLTVTIRRELTGDGTLTETYTFKNTGQIALNFPAGSVAITAPLFDQYPDTKLSLDARCHTHLWMGGASAWINAMRMGTEPPHLGLVVTEGAFESYSQRGGTFNDRGVFLLHPAAMSIKAGDSVKVAWKLFWHSGWDDFFAKLATTPGFVRLTAKDYTVSVGQPLEVTAQSASSLAEAQLFANDQPVAMHQSGAGPIIATIPTTAAGDIRVELVTGTAAHERRHFLSAHVTPPFEALLDARVQFIVRKQQRNAPGTPLDGAYLAYDNETGEQIYRTKNDHNAGRERVGMGVLGALYLPLVRDEAFKVELQQSLRRYSDFVARELENETGEVFNDAGRKRMHRPYNHAWVAHFHVAMYRATGDSTQLDRFVRVIRNYYQAQHGDRFYAIGLPVRESLAALREAGRTAEYDEVRGLFRRHADYLLQNGINYPRSEVNFEQSIVAPSVQMLAEFSLATGEAAYLEGATAQMPILEAFAGRQPDARLNEISIRHWDDFWFGKLAVYGDTMPHYWSAINGLAYAYYGLATKNPAWLRRAETVVKGNLSLFNPDGSAGAAHLYARTTNGVAGARNDPWANDQDWALVYLLTLRALK